MFPKESLLNNFIVTQRKAIQYHFTFAMCLIGTGLLIILIVILWHRTANNELMKQIFGIGGAFISTLSTFPIKEIITRKERIGAIETAKGILKEANKSERKKIEDLIWKIIEQTALR